MARQPSTAAEPGIDSLRMSAIVDPRVPHHIDTVIDIVEEGNEFLPEFRRAYFAPDSDTQVNGWRTETGASTNLFASINQDTTRWPAPGTDTLNKEINTRVSSQVYECTLDVDRFATSGDLENARIGFVSIQAIYASTGAHRKVRTFLRHMPSNTLFAPAGGAIRDVHPFGAIQNLWIGEFNPHEMRPWTPADLAAFGQGGDWRIQVRSDSATTDRFPRVMALSLEVVHHPVENREAVAVWRRPTALADRLTQVTTDQLVTVPDGTPGWDKSDGANYLYIWRQSVSPALYGPVIADDVRWASAAQRLPSDGEPPGVVYPYTANGSQTPEDDHLASDERAYDFNGRLVGNFRGRLRNQPALVPMAGSTPSVDGQPYRMDLGDLVLFSAAGPNAGYVAQRITPATTEDWLGFRFPIIPPFADASITLSVRVQSTGVQVGQSVTFSALDIARLSSPTAERWRYASGFLPEGVTLNASTTYEIRLTPTAASGTVHQRAEWIMPGPDGSLAPELVLGGGTNGLVRRGGTVHEPNRTLTINLLKQPDPPQNFAATVVDVPVETQVTGLDAVEHVELTWDPPATSLGGHFRVYTIERRLDGGDWHRIADVDSEGTTVHQNRELPRRTLAEYRIRVVGAEGRISQWVETGPVQTEAPGSYVILTSDHAPELECVFLYDRESGFPILSTEEDEFLAFYGRDRQVAFMTRENRGVGWQAELTLHQVDTPAKGGQHILTRVLDLVRSMDIPYVAVLDAQGTAVYGQVELSDPSEQRTGHIYRAGMVATPTAAVDDPVPVFVVD
jgi:hypothetical protein